MEMVIGMEIGSDTRMRIETIREGNRDRHRNGRKAENRNGHRLGKRDILRDRIRMRRGIRMGNRDGNRVEHRLQDQKPKKVFYYQYIGPRARFKNFNSFMI